MKAKTKVKNKSKLKTKIGTAKKVFNTVKWVIEHKDMVVKGANTAKEFLSKKNNTTNAEQ